jgi:hypothetical protein
MPPPPLKLKGFFNIKTLCPWFEFPPHTEEEGGRKRQPIMHIVSIDSGKRSIPKNIILPDYLKKLGQN